MPRFRIKHKDGQVIMKPLVIISAILCCLVLSSCKSVEECLKAGNYSEAYNITKTNEEKNRIIDYMIELKMYEEAYDIAKSNDEKNKIISQLEHLGEQMKAFEIIKNDDSFNYSFATSLMSGEVLKRIFDVSVKQDLNSVHFIKVYAELKSQFENMDLSEPVPISVSCKVCDRRGEDKVDMTFYATIPLDFAKTFDLFNSYKNASQETFTFARGVSESVWWTMRANAYYDDIGIEADSGAFIAQTTDWTGTGMFNPLVLNYN